VPHAEALRIRDDVAFFQPVRAVLVKRAPREAKTDEELDLAVRQIVSRALASEGVVDIFAAAGLKKLDISILSEDELAFYDALETNDSAVKILDEPTLKTIARELAAAVRKNVTIDWTIRENVRAQLRVIVKRILRKYDYPPDKQERATATVLEQAAVLSEAWATAKRSSLAALDTIWRYW
jgi:type I restriction enzyme R subunit